MRVSELIERLHGFDRETHIGILTDEGTIVSIERIATGTDPEINFASKIASIFRDKLTIIVAGKD